MQCRWTSPGNSGLMNIVYVGVLTRSFLACAHDPSTCPLDRSNHRFRPIRNGDSPLFLIGLYVLCGSLPSRQAQNLRVAVMGAMQLSTLSSRICHPSSLENLPHHPQETHVRPLSRNLGSKWVRWIAARSRAIGERKPRNARAIIDTAAADTTRTVCIPPNQETDCETLR